jgi:hypothetical protein
MLVAAQEKEKQRFLFVRFLDRKPRKRKWYAKNKTIIFGQYEGRTRDLGVNKAILAPRSNQLS